MATGVEEAERRIAECVRTRGVKLDLSGLGLESLPAGVLGLEWVAELHLRSNKLVALPDALADLPQLKAVDVTGNPLHRVPRLPGLTIDYSSWVRSRGRLRGHPVAGLTLDTRDYDEALLRAVGSLRSFELANKSMPELDVSSLLVLLAETSPDLRHLGLHGKGLMAYAESLSRLTALRELEIIDLTATSIPDVLRRLPVLSHLALGIGETTSLPAWLFTLPSLRDLQLGHIDSNRFPSSIDGTPVLEVLWLAGEQVVDLPGWFGSMTSLRSLTIFQPGFVTFPAVLARIPNLESLNLARSFIQDDDPGLTEIPPTILQCRSLKKLNVQGQPITTPPPEVVERGLEAIKDYWRQRQREGTDYLCEAKLIIVGEPGAGKTSLAVRLLDRHAPLPPPEATTRGIDIRRWQFPTTLPPHADGVPPEARDFEVSLWDFGGQEIYHATHQFFLTRRSVYALVVDERKEDTDFDYWLAAIELLAGDSPVVVITNEKGDRRRALPEDEVRARFPQLRGFFPTNLLDNRGLPEIERQLRLALESPPHIGDALPKSWRAVRKTLEERTEDHLSLDTFFALCKEHGFTRTEDALHLSAYLHDLGICLHFQDDAVLRHLVILRPAWATDAVYRVLDDRVIADNHGTFGPADLQRIWHEAAFKDQHHALLRLMVNFRLCYALPRGDRYIAPQLLPNAAPTWDAPDRWDLTTTWHYKVMPKGLVWRLAVELHEHIEQGGTRAWRSGFVLRWHQARALVREQRSDRRIVVHVSGLDRRALLALIQEHLGRIHKGFPGVVVDLRVACPCDTCRGAGPGEFSVALIQRAAEAGKRLQCTQSFDDIDPHPLLDAIFDPSPSRPAGPATGDIFVSYAWRADTKPVDEVEALLATEGIRLRRDIRELDYRAPIRAFMRRLGRGSAVVVVLSEAYLRSLSCMFELAEIADNGDLRGRVYPLLLGDLPIRDAKFRVAIVKHWEEEIAALNTAMKEVEQSDLQGIQEDMNDLRRIRAVAARLMEVLGDMVCTTEPTQLVAALKLRPR